LSWLEVEQDVPHFTTIRTWMLRLGVDVLNQSLERADDWIWLVDHSNQIGPEKVLCVLGIRVSQLPPPGTALRHEDLRVLVLRPGTKWKREDMAKVYEELAKRLGSPRAIISDGAVELRDGAKPLKTQEEDVLVLRDFKHFAANQLQSLFGRDQRFQTFLSLAGRTRSAIQQTELAHLVPPSPKPKSRFMNLAATLRWAGVIGWLLNHPEAQARQSLDDERVETKLGWLREFAPDIPAWRECQRVLSLSLTFLNQNGVFPGASACLGSLLGESQSFALSRELARRLIAFVERAEAPLRQGERLPISTEILESRFGLYKQLEGQHAQGGFTSLLPALCVLGSAQTPETVKAAFGRTKTQAIKAWVKQHLGETFTARRRSTYAESQSATKQLTAT
jgi:hypothetical protein